MPGLMCKTCISFNGLMGECEMFGVDMGMSKVCDEWKPHEQEGQP